MACDTIKIETLDADEVVSIVTAGPQGPSGAEAATLTTTGDLLYRAALANDRLPIGSEGQVLKVASGLPAWDDESGSVTSVAGRTGAVTLAVADVTDAVATSDSRLTDSRTPTAHAASHATGGTDALAPSDIGAAAASHSHTLADITDVGTAAGFDADQNLGSEDTPTFAGLALHGGDVTMNGSSGAFKISGFGAEIDFENNSISGFGVNARADIFTLFDYNDSTKIGAFDASGITTGNTRTYDLPDRSGELMIVGDAPASHAHGNITNDGKLGTTAGLPVVTTTAGAVTTLALGTAGQVLTVNGTADGVEFAAASGGIGGSTGATDNAILRADGTGGATAQASNIVIGDEVRSFTGVTGDASTDIITVTGSGFSNGQRVRFTALTGGSGLNTTTNYFVINASGDTFQVSTTEGGSFVNFTTNITAGTLINGHFTQVHTQISNTGADTNISLVLRAKGTGAFIFGPPPDDTSTGGIARSANAICMVTNRSAANQVGSGSGAVAIGSRASAQFTNACVIGGNECTASNARAIVCGGNSNTASGDSAFVVGGQQALANRFAIGAHAAGSFAAQGDAQVIRAVLRCKTTTNSAVEMFLDGSSSRLTCPSGKVMAMLINITGVKSDGSAVAHYVRQYAIKNVGGTTSEVYAPVTVGTDTAASTSIAVEANDTNDALRINVTGIASETWRWVACVDSVDMAYGT